MRVSAGMTAATLAGVRSPRRGPLIALLVVDLGLAVAGGLMLRAGLAAPATADAAEVAPAQGSVLPKGPAAAAPAPSAPGPAAPTGPAGSAGSTGSAGSEAPPPAPAQGIAGAAAPAAASPPAPSSVGGEVAAPPADEPGAQPAKEEARGKKKSSRKSPDAPLDPYSADQAQLMKAIDRLFSQNQREFDNCFEDNGGRASKATELTVSFLVVAGGSVAGVQFVMSKPGLGSVQSCIQANLARWSLPGSGGEERFVRRIRFKSAR